MRGYKLRLKFLEDERPYLMDISSLLYDFELLHDLAVLACEEQYSSYKFSRFFWYRNGRPIANKHRLRSTKIIKESPLFLEVVVPSLVGLAALVQLIKTIKSWPLEREKLELEIQKLRREESEDRRRIADWYSDQLKEHLRERNASDVQDKVSERLSRNTIKLSELTIEPDQTDESSPYWRELDV